MLITTTKRAKQMNANANATRAIDANDDVNAIAGDVATLHVATKAKRASKRANDASAKRASDNVKLASDATPAKRAKRVKRDDNATFTLATLARELGISPKIVRAKARRNAATLARDFMSPAKHVYFERDRAAITAFVMRDRKA